MAGTVERINKVEEKVNQLENWRCDSDKKFEAFMAKMDMYITKTDQQIIQDRERTNERLKELAEQTKERTEQLNKRMDKIENKLDNMLIAFGVGIATIVVTIVLTR